MKQALGGDQKKIEKYTSQLYVRPTLSSLERDLEMLGCPSLIVVDSIQKTSKSMTYRREGIESWIHKLEARRAIREKELGPDMIYTVSNEHAQVIWQDDEEGIPEKAILVTNFSGSGLIEIKQGDAEINVNYESIPELIAAMKVAKGMHD